MDQITHKTTYRRKKSSLSKILNSETKLTSKDKSNVSLHKSSLDNTNEITCTDGSNSEGHYPVSSSLTDTYKIEKSASKNESRDDYGNSSDEEEKMVVNLEKVSEFDENGSALCLNDSANIELNSNHNSIYKQGILEHSLGYNTYSYDSLSSKPFDTISQKTVFSNMSTQTLVSEVKSRNYLVGYDNVTRSLLGRDQLEFHIPNSKLRIFIITWNMCEMSDVPDNIDDFLLPDDSEYIQDIYIITTQESIHNKKEWEISLQETIGPNHVLFYSASLGMLYTLIFLRRDLIWFCSMPNHASVSTATSFITKGGLGVSFKIFGTSLLFVNSHLSAHDRKLKNRVKDFHKICKEMKFVPSKSDTDVSFISSDITECFDCVFWSGDLNFRIDQPREKVELFMKSMNENLDFDNLICHDQLTIAKIEGMAFKDFQEGRIKFKPTYKYDVGSNDFDTKKMRIPSYTDRILFRSKNKNSIMCVHYNSVFDFKDSDHKPVYSLLEADIHPTKDLIPLCAGSFDRTVWLEGLKRRASSTKWQVIDSKSSVCTLQ